MLFSFHIKFLCENLNMPSSRGSSQPRDWTQVSHIAGRLFTIRTTREAWRLVKFMSTEPVMLSNHLPFCRPLLIFSSIFPSIRVFSNESAFCIRWPKYWSFSFSISPSNEYSGLISFRIDWFDLLAVHGTLKSFLQHHSSKASVLWCSVFFTVRLSHLWLTTGKTIALTIWIIICKVMSRLFNMQSRFLIAFLPRSKYLNFVTEVTVSSDFGAQENKICHCFFFPLLFAMKWWDWMPWS